MERKPNNIAYNSNTWKDIVLSGVRDGVGLGASVCLYLNSGKPLGLTLVPLITISCLISKKFAEIEENIIYNF